jgi:hypothetical protein
MLGFGDFFFFLGGGRGEKNVHSIHLHRFSSVEIIVVEVGDDFLGITAGVGLEFVDGFLVSPFCLEGVHDIFHIGCVLEEVS